MASVTDGLQRRLLPLQGATFAGGFVLWYGVEKLFMTQLGFDARSIGLFAAAYAAMVPLMDVGFGVLADRWSRKGVLMLGYAALAASSLAGALSLVPVAVGFGAMTDRWGVGTAACRRWRGYWRRAVRRRPRPWARVPS